MKEKILPLVILAGIFHVATSANAVPLFEDNEFKEFQEKNLNLILYKGHASLLQVNENGNDYYFDSNNNGRIWAYEKWDAKNNVTKRLSSSNIKNRHDALEFEKKATEYRHNRQKFKNIPYSKKR